MRKTILRFRAALLVPLALAGALALARGEARAQCPFTPTNDVPNDVEEGEALLFHGTVKLFNVYWGDDWDDNNPGFNRDAIEQAMRNVLATPYFDRLCQYGVNGFELDGSAGSSGICNSDPGSITSTPKIFDFMSCEEYTPFTGVPIAEGAPNPLTCTLCAAGPFDCFDIQEPFCTLTPNPTGSRIYVVFLPRATQIEDFGRFSCRPGSYNGFHFQIPSRGLFWIFPPFVAPFSQGRPLNLAVIPTACFTSVTDMMVTVTHEVVEAATDPLPPYHWIDEQFGDRSNPGDLTRIEELLRNGEIADLCEHTTPSVSFTAPDGTRVSVANYWSNHDNDCVALDVVAPVTTTLAAPPVAGWVNTNVAITLSVTDGGHPPSGPQEVVFSAAGAQTIPELHVAGDSTSLGLGSEGVTTVSFHAQDNAGNVETAKTLTVRIDKTPPAVSYAGNLPTYTVDLNVDITCTATDGLSGIASTTCADVHRPAYELPLGANTLSATAVDLAGNGASASVAFTIQVTEGSLCNLTQRFATKAQIADSLCGKLDSARQAPTLQARAGKLGAFLDELSAQTGKAFSTADAAILSRLAQAL